MYCLMRKIFLCLSQKIDDRYSTTEIASHAGSKVPCIVISEAKKYLIM